MGRGHLPVSAHCQLTPPRERAQWAIGDTVYNLGRLRDGVGGTRRPAFAVALQKLAGGERMQSVPHGPGRLVDPSLSEGGFDVRPLEPVLAQVLGYVLRDRFVDRFLGRR